MFRLVSYYCLGNTHKGKIYKVYNTKICMAEVIIKKKGYKCERCGHQWIPRNKEQPIICPKCKSPYWNKARKRK